MKHNNDTLLERLNTEFPIPVEKNLDTVLNRRQEWQALNQLFSTDESLEENTAFWPYISNESLIKALEEQQEIEEKNAYFKKYDETLKNAKFTFNPLVPASECKDISEYIAVNNLCEIFTKIVLKGLLRYSSKKKAMQEKAGKKIGSFANDFAIEKIITSGYTEEIFSDMVQNIALCFWEKLIPENMVSFTPFENDLQIFDIHFDMDKKAYLKLWNAVQNTFTVYHGHSYKVSSISLESLQEIGIDFENRKDDLKNRLYNLRCNDAFHANMNICKALMKNKMYSELCAIIEGVLRGYNLKTIEEKTKIHCDYVIAKTRFFHKFAIMIQKGYTKKFICETLEITEKTYDRYISKLPADFEKMDLAI